MAKKNINKKKDNDKRPNWILRFTILVILIPVIILAWALISSMGSGDGPVTGDRFKNQLNPEITSAQIESVQKSLAIDNVDSIEVNLKSATLRITLDAKDTLTNKQAKAILNKAYANVDEILPIDKYFTNTEDTRMYDLEIHVFNFVPEDDEYDDFVYHIYTKNAASEKKDYTIPSKARDKDTKDKVLSLPKKGEKVGN